MCRVPYLRVCLLFLTSIFMPIGLVIRWSNRLIAFFDSDRKRSDFSLLLQFVTLLIVFLGIFHLSSNVPFVSLGPSRLTLNCCCSSFPSSLARGAYYESPRKSHCLCVLLFSCAQCNIVLTANSLFHHSSRIRTFTDSKLTFFSNFAFLCQCDQNFLSALNIIV